MGHIQNMPVTSAISRKHTLQITGAYHKH